MIAHSAQLHLTRRGWNDHFCDTTERASQRLFKDYCLHIKGDSLVSQKWGETP